MINYWCTMKKHIIWNHMQCIEITFWNEYLRVSLVEKNQNNFRLPRNVMPLVVWYTCETTSRTWIKCTVDQCYKDVLFQNWYADVNKNHLCKHSIQLCRFQCANHRLPIVSGRYASIDRNKRLCKLCNFQLIGDIFSYIFICPALCYERSKHVKKHFINRPNVQKMKQKQYCLTLVTYTHS